MSENTIQYKRFFLNNGLEIILLKRPERYTAALAGYFRAGSAHETRRLSGASHFVEHLLFRGNKKYKTVKAIDEQQEKLGLSHGANTNYDSVRYRASFPPQELEKSLEFIAYCLFDSNLDNIEVEKERQVMLEEEKLREDNLGIRSWDLALQTRLKDKNHPLAFPREGLTPSIKALPVKRLKQFYKAHFNPSNLTIVIGSNCKTSEAEKIIRKTLGRFPTAKPAKIPQFTIKDYSDFRIVCEKRDVEKVYLYFTMPAFSYDRPIKDWYSLFLLMRILRRIRLDKKLYQEKGLSYDWGAGWSVPSHPIGFLWTYSSCDPKNLSQIIKVFFEELKKIKEEGVSRYELERSRDYLNKIQSMDFDSLGGAVDWFLEDFYYYKKFYSPEEIIAARNSLSQEYLWQIAREVINFKRLNVTVLGPTTKKEVNRMIKRGLAKI